MAKAQILGSVGDERYPLLFSSPYTSWTLGTYLRGINNKLRRWVRFTLRFKWTLLLAFRMQLHRCDLFVNDLMQFFIYLF